MEIGESQELSEAGTKKSNAVVKERRIDAPQPSTDPLPLGEGNGVFCMESLILAQDKRWRRALPMRVERAPTSVGVSGARVRNT
jgi:hypothetical protein